MKIYCFGIVITMVLVSCGLNGCAQKKHLSEPLQIAIKMADSQVKRYCQPWQAEGRKNAYWGYTEGLVSLAFAKLGNETGIQKYKNYDKAYADSLISGDGSIKAYSKEEYNIDNVNSGKNLFRLYSETNDQRYLTAIQTLRNQLNTHPRTSEGGFWHKLKYPHQMWLDGIYMGSPFLAQYSVVFKDKKAIDDAVNQILTVQKHTYDSVSGLNYHGWDESKQQKWADPVSGHSPNFWGRSMGWYCMGIVDVLDFLPKQHPSYDSIKNIFHCAVDAMIKVQDASGVWYQVLDQPHRKGNYKEATVSCMMVYSILKGIRMGYLDKSYMRSAVAAYKGVLENFIRENPDSTISLTNCCSVAGLGGNPYRDGSFEYYIGEPVRNNDPKGVGSFIMAAIEMHLADTKSN
jgi:unsaturated rhamnogalacturonyl hydrolase